MATAQALVHGIGIRTLHRQQQQEGATRRRASTAIRAIKSPAKGFGSPPPNPPKKKITLSSSSSSEDESDKPTRRRPRREEEDDTVPEIVTNRMLKRMGLTVGVPVGLGLLFFPLFYYLKVVRKVEIPEWLPVLTSLVTFGTSGLGISYAVLSSSWDPQREGSFLGWNEARVNWPLLWRKRDED